MREGVETLSGGESFRVGVRRRRKLNKGKKRGRIHSGKNEKKRGTLKDWLCACV
jgi:hypothetical protein